MNEDIKDLGKMAERAMAEVKYNAKREESRGACFMLFAGELKVVRAVVMGKMDADVAKKAFDKIDAAVEAVGKELNEVEEKYKKEWPSK